MTDDRGLLVEFLAWLEVGGAIRTSSEGLADAFLGEREPDPLSDLVGGPDLEIRRPGLSVTVRGAKRASLFGVDRSSTGAGREFVIVMTAGGDPVMLLGPWDDGH